MASCTMCGKFVRVPRAEWKYLDHGAFVCSKLCILKWITDKGLGKEFVPTRVPSPMLTSRLSRPDHCYSRVLDMNFRSLYEQYVAEWFQESEIYFHYETWEFGIGDDKWWTPDFWLPEYNCVVEVKGKWEIGARSKLEKFRVRNRWTPVLVIPWVLRHEFYEEVASVLRDTSIKI